MRQAQWTGPRSPIEIRNSILLRAAHRTEASAIAAMSRLQIEHGLQSRWTTARIRRQIEAAESMVTVASVNGILEGFAIMKFGASLAHLLLLAVESKSRRTGIGTALVAGLEKSCLSANIEHIRLEVRAANTGAVKFYQHLGFTIAEQLTGYYDRKETAVVMTRSLVYSE